MIIEERVGNFMIEYNTEDNHNCHWLAYCSIYLENINDARFTDEYEFICKTRWEKPQNYLPKIPHVIING